MIRNRSGFAGLGRIFCEGLNLDERDREMSTRQRMCLKLERNFSQIGDKRHQDALSYVARALAMKRRRRFVPYCRIAGGAPATPRAPIRGPIQGSSRSTRMPIP